MSWFRTKTSLRYIFFEMLPSFLMGVFVFVSILLLFQALRLTEFVLVHGVKIEVILKLMLYLSISFLPIILPMSLLFSVLLTYSRMSNDSEIVAFKALGLSISQLALPALVIAIVAFILSAQTSFYLGPWGNRQFEVLIRDLGKQKVAATIREGVFSESFFDLVVYANHVDPEDGRLSDVFIYNERDPKAPVTIIAKKGRVLQENTAAGQSAALVLSDGSIHRTHGPTYTKVDFSTYSINLFDPYEFSKTSKSMHSLTLPEVLQELKKPGLSAKQRTELQIERHRRWALSVACLIFALLGVGLGTTTNRRLAKASGFVMCLILIVSYWILYVGAENLARNRIAPVWICIWSVNVIFFVLGIRLLWRSEG